MRSGVHVKLLLSITIGLLAVWASCTPAPSADLPISTDRPSDFRGEGAIPIIESAAICTDSHTPPVKPRTLVDARPGVDRFQPANLRYASPSPDWQTAFGGIPIFLRNRRLLI